MDPKSQSCLIHLFIRLHNVAPKSRLMTREYIRIAYGYRALKKDTNSAVNEFILLNFTKLLRSGLRCIL